MQIGKNFNIIEDFLANPINTRTLPEWLTTPYFRRLYDPKFNRITYSSMDNGLDKIQIIADKTTNCMRNEFSNENIEKISTSIVIEPSKENWMNDENQESEYFTADKSSPLTEKSLTSPCSTKSLKDEILPIVRIIKENKQTTPVGSMEPSNVFAKRFSNDFSPANKSSLFQEFSRRRSVSPMILSSMTSPNRQEFMNKLSNGSFRRYNTKLFSRESFSKRTKRFHSIPREVPLSYSSNCKPTYNTHAAQKPPSIFIFTGDDARLFERISHCLNTLLPPNIYTISSLSLTSFLKHSWIDEKPVCLFLANTSLLNDIAWGRLQAYFVTGGKIIFLCQNSLLASLSHCESRKMQMNILKNAFGSRAANSSLGKDFERFLKKGLKTLAKHKK
uniref:Uncharacterized protein n=1 Tax=Acrobeloides nanus TaxID=290746 RepID=A0A914CIR8_9BILA